MRLVDSLRKSCWGSICRQCVNASYATNELHYVSHYVDYKLYENRSCQVEVTDND